MSAQPGCTASSELCDNQDNDCDGQIDEGVTRTCGPAPVGTCTGGMETCTAGTWSECVGATTPTAEVCDPENLDENCDGASNEGCVCATGETRMCGDPDGECRQGTQSCVDGVWGAACEGAIEPKTEVCDEATLDENCDGSSNENCDCYEGETERCMGNDTAPCSAGTRSCKNGKWGSCTGVKGPQSETCDEIDNDCDATTDEDSCSGSARCVSGRCVTCTNDSDCQSMTNGCKEGYCDGTSCKQRNKDDHTECVSGATRGVCRRGECFDGCIDETDCASGEECVAGTCELPARCGDGYVNGDEECDPENAQFTKWSCNSETCEKIYIYTRCDGNNFGPNSNECGGGYCDSTGVCLTACSGATGPDSDPYVCDTPLKDKGTCIAGGCVIRCTPGSSSCPLGSSCNAVMNDPRTAGYCR